MTYAELLKEATKHISSEIIDYRPACGLYVEGMDDCEQIPRAIVCWLENGSQIIYINNDKGKQGVSMTGSEAIEFIEKDLKHMSDLISRSELLKEIEKYKFGAISNDAEREYIKKTILDFIICQPTAYSVDRVVEELREIVNPKEMYFCRVSKGRCIHDEDDIGCIDCLAQKAIEIVKSGGVSDDCCEWKIFDNSLTGEPQWVYETTCGKYVGEEHTSKAFVYCPYCSKKIKVVE